MNSIKNRFFVTAAAISVVALGSLLATPSAIAEDLIGNFGNWSAFVDGKGKGKICYIASVPKKEVGKYKARGNSYILVTHRPGDKARDVIELRAGYTYKKSSNVSLAVGDTTFSLFTDGGTAWARDEKTDAALAKAMIKGKDMVVKGTSSRDTNTTDTYSLIGFTAAYKAIGKACGVK